METLLRQQQQQQQALQAQAQQGGGGEGGSAAGAPPSPGLIDSTAASGLSERERNLLLELSGVGRGSARAAVGLIDDASRHSHGSADRPFGSSTGGGGPTATSQSDIEASLRTALNALHGSPAGATGIVEGGHQHGVTTISSLLAGLTGTSSAVGFNGGLEVRLPGSAQHQVAANDSSAAAALADSQISFGGAARGLTGRDGAGTAVSQSHHHSPSSSSASTAALEAAVRSVVAGGSLAEQLHRIRVQQASLLGATSLYGGSSSEIFDHHRHHSRLAAQLPGVAARLGHAGGAGRADEGGLLGASSASSVASGSVRSARSAAPVAASRARKVDDGYRPIVGPPTSARRRLTTPTATAASAAFLPQHPHAGDRPAGDSRPPVLLYSQKDDASLSRYQCLVRQQIEMFEATDDDVQFNISRMSKIIVLGQVGIRCRHCAVLPEHGRPKAAVYYPRTLDSIYQFGQNMVKNHLLSCCELIPAETKGLLLSLQESRKRGRGGRERWARAAQEAGVVEADHGLQFAPL